MLHSVFPATSIQHYTRLKSTGKMRICGFKTTATFTLMSHFVTTFIWQSTFWTIIHMVDADSKLTNRFNTNDDRKKM